MSRRWDLHFLNIARETSKLSKDPSTQVGAVVVSRNRNILSSGYNGFPRGVLDTPSRYADREQKYKYTVHAEQNVIYNATYNGVSLNGADLYVYGLPVCSECAKGVIQVGISKVVMPKLEYPKKWFDSWQNTKELFREAKVDWKFIEVS
ncbi:MAG: dCMP deaminase family protein [Candidatus Thiodiazotropha taylori]|uniref:dCMP deaminase family protein n=1 Tax=Candidatus Thiodiazotropha taylori TaxID=2792791 RepID=A0A9E4KA88_9GAMM|nr:dCMP deaminase family protein [Candidatus Thiodiazotropha taylori]MCW4255088.1 dCMP deaminase family protein [Candidatus Thiodiazotropha taylori]